MNTRKNIITISLGVLLFIILFIYIFQKEAYNGLNYDWTEQIATQNRQPYSTEIFYKLFQKYPKEYSFHDVDSILKLPIQEDLASKSIYTFVGKNYYLQPEETAHLHKFVYSGGTAFIAAAALPASLRQNIFSQNDCDYLQTAYLTIADSLISVGFYQPLDSITPINADFKYGAKITTYDWDYMPDNFFCSQNSLTTKLAWFSSNHYGQDHHFTNFFEIKHGKGAYYVHTQPILFTNYYMLNKAHLDYISTIIAYLPEGNIYWDTQNANPKYKPTTNTNSAQKHAPSPPKESPLKYILSQPSLRWAWYLSILMTILYIVFYAKRQQRIIPIIEPNTNSSLAFMQTIGSLGYQQNDHKGLAELKWKLFEQHVRNRYKIILPQKPTDSFFESFSTKTNIPAAKLQDLFSYYHEIQLNGAIDAHSLSHFHFLLDDFYRKTYK